MERRTTGAGSGRQPNRATEYWTALERITAPAFLLAGVLLLVSVIAPVGLEPFTDWYWAAGIAIVGIAVLSAVAGLAGQYPAARRGAPRLARFGLLSGSVAALAALGLVALAAVAVGSGLAGVALAEPTTLFAGLALAMAGGLSLGYLSVGIALVRVGGSARIPGLLLAVGGGVLTISAAGEVLRLAIGVGPPAWTLFPVLGLVCLDTLLVGYGVRSESMETV